MWKPDALDKLNWMAKLLYSLKISLLETQIGQFPDETIASLLQTSKI